jgi:hypothetical protein
MKITEATPEQKIKALAKLDGLYFGVADYDPEECWRDANTKQPINFNLDYLTSYDAIIPLIQKQPVSIQMALDLYMRIEGVAFWTVATPTQLADALLVATGKFEA